MFCLLVCIKHFFLVIISNSGCYFFNKSCNCCCSLLFLSLRVMVRQRWRKAHPVWTLRILPRASPETEIRSTPRLLLQPDLRQSAQTLKKLPRTLRAWAALLPSSKTSLCGNPFPLCCRIPKGTPTLISGNRAARPRRRFHRPLPATTVITQVGCFLVYFYYIATSCCFISFTFRLKLSVNPPPPLPPCCFTAGAAQK